MTIQVMTHNTSKAVLKAALEASAEDVVFYDPSIVNERTFSGESVRVGDRFPVVMDHPKRMRFAQVERTAKGWRVS